MKVVVVSKNVAKVDLEYQAGGLSQENLKTLINLCERAIFKMRELEEKEYGEKRQMGLVL